MDKLDYCIRIQFSNHVFRFGTDRIITDEGEAKAVYYPYIKSIEAPSSVLSLEGDAAVASSSATIWDGNGVFYESLKRTIFEKAKVELMVFEDGLFLYSMKGSIADVSKSEDFVGISLRLSEKSAAQSIATIFKPTSFEYTDMIVPSKFYFDGSWSQYPDCPWSVYRVERHRAKLRTAFNFDRYIGTDNNLSDRIRLNVDSNSLKYYEIGLANANPFSQDSEGDTSIGGPATIVDEQVLVENNRTSLFNGYYDGTGPLPTPSSYYKAQLGNSENLGYIRNPGTDINASKDVCEIIKYSYYGEGYRDVISGAWVSTPGQWYLSGIPVYYVLSGVSPAYDLRDPLGLGGAVLTENALYVIKYKHSANTIVAQVGETDNTTYKGMDVVFMKANGFTPDPEDPDFGAGFIWLGATREHPIITAGGTRKQKVLSRYKITDVYYGVYDEDLNDGSEVDVIRLEIHNRPLDLPVHTYAVSRIPLSRAEVPDSFDIDFIPEVYQYEHMVSAMDIIVPNIDEQTYNRLASSSNDQYRLILKDRFRGLRIDQIKSLNELLSSVGRSNNPITNPSEYAQENISNVNNATGRFAVVSGSEVIYDEDYTPARLFERLYFHVADEFGSYILTPDPNLSSGSGDVRDLYVTSAKERRDKLFMNYMTFKLNYPTANFFESLTDYGESEANIEFMNSRYRIVYDPVPENSEALGKYFPIIYGYNINVPIMQVISKKTLQEGEETAGDDVYIYASHPCDVVDAKSITLSIFDDKGSSKAKTPEEQRDYTRASVSKHLVKSPFPDYVDGHYEKQGDTLVQVGRLDTPYHELIDVSTIEGVSLKGVRLSGYKWNAQLGALDKRFPIRNGLGSQQVYGTLAGWTDLGGIITGVAGSVIRHPMDVIKHFIVKYGKYPFNMDIIDSDNMNFIKSRTPKYESAVFLDEEVSAEALISGLCEQFGIYWTIHNGKIKFSLGELEDINYSKPIIEGLNIIGPVSEAGLSYSEVYNRIVYSYGKNYVSGKYNNVIDLNYTNNSYCSKNNAALGEQKTLSIDANFVNSSLVAQRVAVKYAKYICTRRVTYTLSLRRIEGIDYAPGDVVPIKYSPYSLDYDPVIIKEVRNNLDKTDLVVVYYPELRIQRGF
jgi:hypothetical protein